MRKKHKTLRFKLTAFTISIFLLICIFLTAVSIFSSGVLTEAVLLNPALPSDGTQIIPNAVGSANPTLEIAKRQFNLISLTAMVVLACFGSIGIYFIVKRELRPLESLAMQVSDLEIDNINVPIKVEITGDEVQQLATALDDMAQRVSLSYMVQKNFSANAAHELRTPLAIMQTQFDVFSLKKERNKEEYEKLFASLMGNTQRLSNLVTDLLSFTNEQQVDLSKDVDLHSLIDDIVFDLEPKCKEKNIEISVFGEGAVKGSDSLLQRAFYNLIFNAIRYNVEGGSINIEITDNAVKIADTGIGVPDEAKPHIFDSFFCVDKSRSRQLGGSGLGLAITKNIIEKHDGFIYIEDNKPQGSIFVVNFVKP